MFLKSAISKRNGLIPNMSMICHLQQVQWFLDFVRKECVIYTQRLSEAIISKLTF